MFTALLTATETVGLIRDITVIAFLALAFLILFVLGVLGIILYRRANRLMRRADRAINKLEATFETIQDAAEATRSTASAIRTGLTSGFGVANVFKSVAGTLIGGRTRRRRDRRRSGDE